MKNRLQIFISAATSEFLSSRVALREALDQLEVTVKTEETLVQSGLYTLENLADYIANCDLVIHLAGHHAGATPVQADFDALRRRLSSLHDQPSWLNQFFETEMSSPSYTQWEAYLALYFRRRLVVAIPKSLGSDSSAVLQAPSAEDSQAAHIRRMFAEAPHPIRFVDVKDLIIQVQRAILNLRYEAAMESVAGGLHDRFGKDSVDALRLILSEATPLRSERFLFTACALVRKTIDPDRCNKLRTDLDLINRLAEQKEKHDLLVFAYLCNLRAQSLRLTDTQESLFIWIQRALRACNLTLDAVRGRFADLIASFDPQAPPTPRVQIAWKEDSSSAERRVFPMAFLRWGSQPEAESVLGTRARSIRSERSVTLVVDTLLVRMNWSVMQALDRLEVFVEGSELNFPWEYRCGETARECNVLHPWPTTLRLHRKQWEKQLLRAPAKCLSLAAVVLMLDGFEVSMEDVRSRGAFLAMWPEQGEPADTLISSAAASAGLGCWLRTKSVAADFEQFIQALDGVPVEVLPRKIDSIRRTAAADSAHRHIGIMFDIPGNESAFVDDEPAYDDIQVYQAIS